MNNNIVLAVNEQQEEMVVFGTGIGFKKKKGDELEEEKITKIFKNTDNQDINQFLKEIPNDVLMTTEKIIEYGEKALQCELSSNLLFLLADHLWFAIQRQKEQIEISNPLQWEIPILYQKEYEIGKKALEIVEQELQILLPESEISFIALHFVNAQIESNDMQETFMITELIKAVIRKVQQFFGIQLKKDTVSYSRFITHIRYFIIRQKELQHGNIDLDLPLQTLVEQKYPQSFLCAEAIIQMMEEQYHWQISKEELVYLTIHIERVMQENNQKKNHRD